MSIEETIIKKVEDYYQLNYATPKRLIIDYDHYEELWKEIMVKSKCLTNSIIVAMIKYGEMDVIILPNSYNVLEVLGSNEETILQEDKT